jgi:uncharacterized protein (DUF885 family)
VGARLQALAKDPARFYADDDAGRAQLIAYCNERVEAFRALMPQISKLGLKVPLQIKRVPADIEAGAALGYMNFASLDGSSGHLLHQPEERPRCGRSMKSSR